MPKGGKNKVKAVVKPLAFPSLDNEPRYSTPEAQQQLPTPERTPAVTARNRKCWSDYVVSLTEILTRAKVSGKKGEI